MCEIDTGDYCEVWRQSLRRARKPRSCDCCGADIRPGSTYRYTFSVFDGNADTCFACLTCDKAMKKFGEAHKMTPHPTAFVEYLQNCIDEKDPGYERWQRVLRSVLKRASAARLQKAASKNRGLWPLVEESLSEVVRS